MQRPEVPLQKKKNVNGWDQHKPFSENRVYKICIESLLFIYSKKSIFYWTDENKKYRKDCLPAV